MKRLPAILAALPLLGASASAAVLFSDSFDRSDSPDLDASLTGITDNTGSSLATGGVYSTPWIDPANDPNAGTAADGGAVRIVSNTLQLAVGAGTSNAFINHNFINPSILADGGFSVSFEVTANSSGGYQQGGALAIGMSASDAALTSDSFLIDPGMVGAFADASVIGQTVPGTVVSDFWIALRGNGSLAWGGSSGNIEGLNVGSKFGTVSVDFTFDSFVTGSTVNYEVSFNGASQGTGSFGWSGTDENYIGLDARDGTAVGFDNLTIETIPEPSVMALATFALAGLVRRRR